MATDRSARPAHRPPPSPRPIRTTPDNEFAHTTVTTRLPANIRNASTVDPDLAPELRSRLGALSDEIAGDHPIPAPSDEWWDADAWLRAWAPHAGSTWHDAVWYFAETYAFRLVLDRVRYFETERDPFAPFKRADLASGTAFLPIERFARRAPAPDGGTDAVRERLATALTFSLWGNRADVSFHSGGPMDHSEHDDERLLRDDRSGMVDTIVDGNGPVDMILDNAGAELAADLQLAAEIVEAAGTPVRLHVKRYPTYVSDTTTADIHATLAAAHTAGGPAAALATRLEDHFGAGNLRVLSHPVWCEPHYLVDTPLHLARLLSSARLLIVKGDFNYRRVFRDTLWSTDVPDRAASGLVPASLPTAGGAGASPAAARLAHLPIALLRTMKSDVLVGVDPARVAQLDRDQSGWRTAGRHGVAQLIAPVTA